MSLRGRRIVDRFRKPSGEGALIACRLELNRVGISAEFRSDRQSAYTPIPLSVGRLHVATLGIIEKLRQSSSIVRVARRQLIRSLAARHISMIRYEKVTEVVNLCPTDSTAAAPRWQG
jgi:hypothetical protein